MPVKKPKKRGQKKREPSERKQRKDPALSSNKVHPKRSISTEDRIEAKQAVRAIPGLIVEHVRLPTVEPEFKHHSPVLSQSPTNRNTEQKKKTLLWVGVGTIALTIFFLWFLNLKTSVYDLRRDGGNEMSLIRDIERDFNDFVKIPLETKDRENTIEPGQTASVTPLEEQEVKAILQTNVRALLSELPTSSPTTTPRVP